MVLSHGAPPFVPQFSPPGMPRGRPSTTGSAAVSPSTVLGKALDNRSRDLSIDDRVLTAKRTSISGCFSGEILIMVLSRGGGREEEGGGVEGTGTGGGAGDRIGERTRAWGAGRGGTGPGEGPGDRFRGGEGLRGVLGRVSGGAGPVLRGPGSRPWRGTRGPVLRWRVPGGVVGDPGSRPGGGRCRAGTGGRRGRGPGQTREDAPARAPETRAGGNPAWRGPGKGSCSASRCRQVMRRGRAGRVPSGGR